MEKPRRILLIRPSALGDVCRTVPVLASLRAGFPDAEIDWLVQDSFAPAIDAHPALTRSLPFPRKAVSVGRLWRPGAIGTLLAFFRSLRGRGYDLVLDCQGLGRSGLFAFVTGGARRIGFRRARELGWLGVNHRVEVPREMHAVDRMLALLGPVGVPPLRDMRLYTHEADRGAVRAALGDEPYGVIAPTSRWAGKRWPIERFTELARALLDASPMRRLAIVGGPNERDQCAPLLELARASPRVIDLVGSTPVGLLMAVIQRAGIVIANDSAPVHMAVGFDRPLVAIFGPTRTDLVGPYGRERDVIRAAALPARNLHKDEAYGLAAMRSIAASTVIEAALSRIEP